MSLLSEHPGSRRRRAMIDLLQHLLGVADADVELAVGGMQVEDALVGQLLHLVDHRRDGAARQRPALGEGLRAMHAVEGATVLGQDVAQAAALVILAVVDASGMVRAAREGHALVQRHPGLRGRCRPRRRHRAHARPVEDEQTRHGVGRTAGGEGSRQVDQRHLAGTGDAVGNLEIAQHGLGHRGVAHTAHDQRRPAAALDGFDDGAMILQEGALFLRHDGIGVAQRDADQHGRSMVEIGVDIGLPCVVGKRQVENLHLEAGALQMRREHIQGIGRNARLDLVGIDEADELRHRRVLPWGAWGLRQANP